MEIELFPHLVAERPPTLFGDVPTYGARMRVMMLVQEKSFDDQGPGFAYPADKFASDMLADNITKGNVDQRLYWLLRTAAGDRDISRIDHGAVLHQVRSQLVAQGGDDPLVKIFRLPAVVLQSIGLAKG